MPLKQKAAKKAQLVVGDSGVPASDDSPGDAEVAGNNSAPAGATAGGTSRKCTRESSRSAVRSASVDAGLATATEVQMSQANLSAAGLTPMDRGSTGNPSIGDGNRGVIRNTGSNVGGSLKQGSGLPQVFLGVGKGDAVTPNRLVADWSMCPASSSALADYPAFVTSANTTAIQSVSVDHPVTMMRAIQSVSADHPATTTRSPVPYLPDAEVQHLPSRLPQGVLGLVSMRSSGPLIG
jgi:hypothetical protein